jgi:hypothetical protein
MLNIKDIASRALYRPKVYVPALTDEIVRLRREVQHYRTGLTAVQDLCQTGDVEIIRHRVLEMLSPVENQCSP